MIVPFCFLLETQFWRLVIISIAWCERQFFCDVIDKKKKKNLIGVAEV